MMMGLAAEHGEQKTVMIDAAYLKAPPLPGNTASLRERRTASCPGPTKGGVAA
jgi:hypothetical protein